MLTSVAHAAFPGGNGLIAHVSTHHGNPEIHRTVGSERLTTHPAEDRSPAFNVSGTELAFASNRDGDFEIYRMPATGSPTPTPLTNNSVADTDPAWAPNDTQLVIVREAAGGDTDLVILAADGSGATTPLTAAAAVSGEVEPTWAANGSRIGFAAIPPGGTLRDIFAINPDGTGLTNLTNSPDRDDREPNWSPGNARIAYSSLHDSNYEIHVMNAGGTGDANITNYPAADDRDPAWSPDATRIAFTSGRHLGTDHIFNIASTGQHPFRETFQGTNNEPDWQRVPPAACQDGVDNDGDGDIDYPTDPGCNSSTDNDETNPVCNDGVDNDGDGKTDYPEDRGCWWSGDGDEVNPECVDGIDNDGDGLTDHPADPGCFDTVFDDNEFNIACYDNFDNDGDGQVDYPDDPGCTSQDDQDETNPACNDDSDNDGDGLVDFPDDTGCYSLQDPDEVNPACIDGIDNDGDGLTDHPDDLGCISTEDNNETNPACIDGIDNDGDGATDYPNDASCTGTADNDELNPTACTDRKDNDGDSEIDFPNDPGCASQSDNDEFNQPQVYVRPKSARDITLSLVPSFNACTSPNRQHGPPLDSPSCSPPVQASATVTVGTTDSNGASTNSVGRVNLTVFPGDVRVAGSISDVRCRPEFTRTCGSANAAGGADYVGQLRGTHRLRITDRWNETSGVGGTEPGTVVDFPFPIVFSCAGTASDTIGATCTVDSSMNAIVPDAVRDGKRAIFDVGQLVINDAGTDGNIDTPPNRAFLTQGVFAP